MPVRFLSRMWERRASLEKTFSLVMSPEIIMEEVGCWSTYYIDAYGNGESKMEFCRCHGGSRLMVDLLDAHVQGGTKMEP